MTQLKLPKIDLRSYNGDTDFTAYAFAPWNYRVHAKVRASRVAARVQVLISGVKIRTVLVRVDDPEEMPEKIRRSATRILHEAIKTGEFKPERSVF